MIFYDPNFIENEEKEHAFDFVLWKGRKEELEPSWKSPWGMGRPGLYILAQV